MESININVTSEQKQFLDSLNNYSDYIREAIDKERGKADLSIQDLEISVNSKKADLENEELKLMSKVEQLLQHKEELKTGEIKQLEDIQAKKDKELLDFMNYWSPILDSYEEIHNFEFIEGWDSMANLTPIIDMLRKNNIRLGFIQLRLFLSNAQKSE